MNISQCAMIGPIEGAWSLHQDFLEIDFLVVSDRGD